jgi:hypothetical protein
MIFLVVWTEFVTKNLQKWKDFNLYWVQKFKKPLLVVKYDSLVENLEVALRRILDFLEHPINENLLYCTLVRREGVYKRIKRINEFDPYTFEMKRAIEETRSLVYAELGIE